MRVLVTGASGFVGRHCLKFLKKIGAEIHAVARHPGSPAEGIRWHFNDLLEPIGLNFLEKIKPSHLLHLAWIARPRIFWTSPENLTWVASSLRLLKTFAEAGGHRAVLVGSCTEYDWNFGNYLEESTPLQPNTLYGTCKNAYRAMAEAYAKQVGISLAWARLFFLYGPGEHPERFVASVICSLLDGRKAPCSAGTQQRDFLYVEDTAEALVKLLVADQKGAFNICSGQALSIKSIAQAIAELMGQPDFINLGALPTPPHEPPIIVGNPHRMHTELLWSPRFDLRRGLENTIAWWREKKHGE